MGVSIVFVSRFWKPSDSALDPHGNLAMLDKDDVATYCQGTIA